MALIEFTTAADRAFLRAIYGTAPPRVRFGVQYCPHCGVIACAEEYRARHGLLRRLGDYLRQGEVAKMPPHGCVEQQRLGGRTW